MADDTDKQEPTMDEILASIRRIIADDSDPDAVSQQPPAAPAAAPKPVPVEAPEPEPALEVPTPAPGPVEESPFGDDFGGPGDSLADESYRSRGGSAGP